MEKTLVYKNDRRESKRYECDIKANIYSYGVEDMITINNISENGCCITSDRKYYKLGDLLKMQFLFERPNTSSAKIIDLQCRIVRITKKDNKTIMGCKIIHGDMIRFGKYIRYLAASDYLKYMDERKERNQ